MAANTNQKKGRNARNGEHMSEEKYKLSGTIKVIFDLQTFPSGFTKREFVVETDGKYQQLIKLGLMKDKALLIDGYSEGDQVEVHFDLTGREYNEKYFIDLNAWKIGSAGNGSKNEETSKIHGESEDAGSASPARDQASHTATQEGDENLPF